MADLQRAVTAFKNAHDAGDTAAASKLAALVRQLQAQEVQGSRRFDPVAALREAQGRYQPPESVQGESTMGEEFMRTLRGTLSSGRTGLASLAGDENEQARAGLERSAAISEDYGTGPSFEKVKDVYKEDGLLAAAAEGIGQVPRYITQQLPTLAQAIAGAKVGAMIPGPPQLKAAGAIAGGIGAFLPSFAGSNIERRAQEQQEAGQEVDVNVGGAYGTAIGQSALQGVGSAAILGKNIVRGVLGIAAKEVPEEIAEQGLRTLAERGVLNNIARRGAVGVVGEVPTEVAQQMLERSYAGLPLADEEAMAEYGEAAYASALGGGVLGGATGVTDRRINQGNLEAFEAKKIISDTPVVGADGTVKGRMILTQNPDGSVTRQNIDAKGELFGTDEYSGEQAANIFAYGKDKERARTPVNENDLFAQGFTADEKKEETPPAAADQEPGEPGAVPVEVTDEMKAFADSVAGAPTDTAVTPPVDTAAVTPAPVEEAVTPTPAPAATPTPAPAATPAPAVTPAPVEEVVTPAAPAVPKAAPTPDKTRAQKALESDDLGEVYDALRIEQEGGRVLPADRPLLDSIDKQLNETYAEMREMRGRGEAVDEAAMTELETEAEQLYAEKRKARGSREADTPLVKQLRDKADELYAKKYPGITTAKKAELELLQEERAATRSTTVLSKAQKKPLLKEINDKIATLENEQVALSPEALAKASEKRRAEVGQEVIPATKEDKAAVNKELNKDGKRVKGGRDGGFIELDQYVRRDGLDLGLRGVAYDIVSNDPSYYAKEEEEFRKAVLDKAQYNRAIKAQTWVKSNLSSKANAAVDRQIAEFQGMRDRGEKLLAEKDAKLIERNKQRAVDDAIFAEETEKAEKRAEADLEDPSLRQLKASPVDTAEDLLDSAREEEAGDVPVLQARVADALQDVLGDLGLDQYLEVDAVAASSIPMTEAQIDLANKGDLSGVMQNIEDDTANADVGRLAKALKANIGDTKLEVVDGLTGADGKQVAGLFDPKTNTIKLNSRVMLRPHTIMHETTHAATSHILKNKSHPVTKALTKLFDDVKSQLDTEYGATSLDEFVAEVFSNVQFRQKLAAIMVSAGNGKQITAMQRFKNAVGNLLRTLMGRPTVSLDRKEDALTQADALIRNILSPAPNVRNAPEMYAMLTEGGKSAEPVMATILAPFRGASTTIDPQALARARAVLAPMSRARVEMMTYLLPLNAQIEIAADIIPSAKGLFPLLQRKKATRDNEMQKVTDLKKILEKPFKGKVKQREIFNNVVAYSTIEKVDPSLTPAQAKKKYGENPEKMAAYEDMTKNYWSKLSPAQQAAYKELRDYYADGYQKIRKLIATRIEEMTSDKDQKDKLKVLLLDEVLSKESIEPYFPLSRSGKFWLEYNGVSPYTGQVEVFKRSFDSLAERDLELIEVRKDPKLTEVRAYERAQMESGLEKVPTGFAYRIMNQLRATNAPKEVQDMITEMLLNAMPENSLARMFKPRAGTLGFKIDALTVLQDRAPSIITQVTNLEYDGPLSKQLTMMQADAEASTDPNKQVWLDGFTKYIDYSRAPFIAPWSRRFKSLGFLYTLGFNVSSVLVNMTNPAVVTYPYLGGQFGFDKALKAMARAHNVYMSAGGKKTKVPYVTKRRSSYDLKHMNELNQSGGEGVDTEIMSAPNLSNIDFSDLSKVPEDLRHFAALEEAMRTRGQSNRSMLTEVNEFNGENLYSKIINLSGLMFHQGERMNRNISGIAAYLLKLEQMLNGRPVSSATEKEMQDAADYAIEVIELTNSGSMAETAPRISQGPIGSVLFMYKRFGISMLYLQYRMLRQALKAGDLNKEERNIAKRQILGLFFTSGAIAGIRGMPMVGPIIWLWNMTKDEDEEDADTILQNYVGEGPFNGILNYTFGLDVAPRIGMTDLLFRSLPNQESTSLADTAFNMAGPIAGIANRVYQGWGLMREGEIYRGAERMLPAPIANGMKAYRYAGEGATTLRGDPITDDISPGHAFGQLLGFAPAGYTRQLERNAMVKRVDRSISETRTRLMRKYYIAMREFDFNTMMDAQQEMLEFSLKHPEVPITSDTIESSVRQHRITDEMTRQLGGITVGRRRFATVMQQNMEDGF